MLGEVTLFQFPPPRGGERLTRPRTMSRLNFNSRPREGANERGGVYVGGRSISIPAPARGRTNPRCPEDGQYPFQFPPPRGGELAAGDVVWVPSISIPAPVRGRTGVTEDARDVLTISIPAPVRGRTPALRGEIPPGRDFNSRPREGANPLHSIRPRRQR